MIKSFLIIAIVTFLLALQTIAQDAKVKRAVAVTSEDITFNAWVTNQRIKFGGDIVINYRVDNNSKQTIYLVHKNIDETVIEDDNIFFPYPFVLVSGHEEYDYSFTKVISGGSLTGQLKVSQSEYKESKTWLVKVGFGYVTDLKGLNPKPEEIKDPIPFKSLLSSRLKTLELSSLSVEVIED
ncbi:MAG: hypothetical protein M3367_04555 [Acidobacteriota bacterium]|nr:hypothetical protein [Acidobacteriota bacterium]